MRSARWGLVILWVWLPSAVAARPQQDSLAEAARRAQEQKKSQSKAAKVWDNDNVPMTNENSGINVVGPASAPEAAAAGEKPAPKPAPEQKAESAATSEDKDAIEAELQAAKELLTSLKTDLDIAQRKYQLDYQSLMGKPDSARDKEAAATLRDEKSQVDAKQQEVADAQKKVDDLQAKLDALANASR